MTHLPPDLAAALAATRSRTRELLARRQAVTDADGPDEYEAAQARLYGYLDAIEETDRTDLARLGYYGMAPQ
jgi:hypothetical protein